MTISTAFDILVAGILTIFSLVIHRISVALFNSESALYGIATDGTAVFSGAERAAFISEFLILWLPLMIFAFGWLYALIRVFRRQAVTAKRQVR